MSRLFCWIWPAFNLILVLSCGPRPQGVPEPGSITVTDDPWQETIGGTDPIRIRASGYDITINPVAEYELSALVLGRRNYGSGWTAAISPCDLAVAWGKMVITGLYERVSWSQSDRWYYWRYREDFPFDNSFISRYSSNVHAIPANQNLRAALLRIGSGDTISIYGYLVRINAHKDGRHYWWNSSLSRNDTGDGSCEVMYIKEIKHRGMLYR